jgi:hypothetical protein
MILYLVLYMLLLYMLLLYIKEYSVSLRKHSLRFAHRVRQAARLPDMISGYRYIL